MTAPRLEEPIALALDALLPAGVPQRSPGAIESAVRALAHRAHEAGMADALLDLCTTEEMAALLGVERSVVAKRASARGVGIMVNPRVRLFSRSRDLPLLQPGKPGRKSAAVR